MQSGGKSRLEDYEFTAEIERVDWARVHSWLASSYWTPGIPLERVKRAAENSALVLSGFKDFEQVAFLRVVSDRTRFAYLCDVWVDEAHRGKGLARKMVQTAMNHPDFNTCNWLLATRDAHGVYAALGFTPLANPGLFMARGTFGGVQGKSGQP
ncbi:MAG TPA: GNAT family N-acetyltransferase [Candidatus Kapabacteria bacterium]|nr:GNAT family N-acetyltransferase [Candidatus Kapabacteria bacterium]